MANQGYSKSIEGVNLVFGFLVATGFDEKLKGVGPNPEQWGGVAAFVIGMTVVARYTIGAANHLTKEYGSGGSPSPGAFAFDASFLLLYGLLARLSGLARTWQTFFVLLALIFLKSIFWTAMCDPDVSWLRRVAHWKFWTGVNLTSLVVAVIGWAVYTFVPDDRLAPFTLLFPASFVAIMIWDLKKQLSALVASSSAEPTSSSGPGGYMPHVIAGVSALSFLVVSIDQAFDLRVPWPGNPQWRCIGEDFTCRTQASRFGR